MMKKILLLLFGVLLFSSTYATHNRAGEITYRQLSALQYEFTLTTFTDVSNAGNADRPTATMLFGDGTQEERPRVEKTLVGPFIQRNRYLFTHTFPGYSTYIISYQDPNRNNNVQNMLNSVNTAFYVETELVINPFIGFNNSPVLLLEPIDFGGLNKLYVHNPNAFDIDGDSLSFKLVPCKQDVGEDVYGFKIPDVANGFASIKFEIDPVTGQLVWENPIRLGLYNIAIMVEEWRFITKNKKYIRIGYIVRDMQIEIVNTDNNPPVITTIKDTCIIAGQSFNIQVHATDVDNDRITLSATGGPFEIGLPDTVIFPQNTVAVGNVVQDFYWRSTCNSVRKQPYQIVFKAIDNGSPKLVDLEDWQIHIVSPAPKNLIAIAQGNGINLTWNKLECLNAVGYKIYRRNNSNPFTPTICETGLSPDKGYELIKTINDINELTFRDNDNGNGLAVGRDYCYRIIAFFPDGAESIASNESCNHLTRDVPSITMVSIDSTNISTGKDTLIFSKPTELDTAQYSGPYEFRWYQSANNSPFQLIKTVTGNVLGNILDTTYSEENINTLEKQFLYRVDLYSNNQFVGSSRQASSIFLSSNSAENQKVELTWSVNTPWENDSFIVYRQNKTTSIFDSIGVSYTTSYSDSDLTDGVNYCYLVKSIGQYHAGGFAKPIINFSQIYCAEPQDTRKPEAPTLQVNPSCALYRNELSWTPSTVNTGDVVKYNIYKSPFEGSDFVIIHTTLSAAVITYSDINLLQSIAGCYFVTAIDSFNNESARSNMVCVDNCPELYLPNVFTPNGDNINDLFKPIKDSINFVEKVQISIYNRYGKLIFQTNDPQINWNGKENNTGGDMPEGTYFYTIEYSEVRLVGLKPKAKTGFIELIR
jgi:gliding motility-associated-like protein